MIRRLSKFAYPLLLLTFYFASCLDIAEPGVNTLIKESVNSKGLKKAILFLKQAGATVPDSYQVTVCDKSHKLSKAEGGNTFTVDTNHGEAWLNSNSINFTWLTNDTLQIDYDKKLRPLIQKTKVDDVIIVYITR